MATKKKTKQKLNRAFNKHVIFQKSKYCYNKQMENVSRNSYQHTEFVPDVIHFHHLIKQQPLLVHRLCRFLISVSIFPESVLCYGFCCCFCCSSLWCGVCFYFHIAFVWAPEQLKRNDDLYLYGKACIFYGCFVFLFWYNFHLSFWHSRLSSANGLQATFVPFSLRVNVLSHPFKQSACVCVLAVDGLVFVFKWNRKLNAFTSTLNFSIFFARVLCGFFSKISHHHVKTV